MDININHIQYKIIISVKELLHIKYDRNIKNNAK